MSELPILERFLSVGKSQAKTQVDFQAKIVSIELGPWAVAPGAVAVGGGRAVVAGAGGVGVSLPHAVPVQTPFSGLLDRYNSIPHFGKHSITEAGGFDHCPFLVTVISYTVTLINAPI